MNNTNALQYKIGACTYCTYTGTCHVENDHSLSCPECHQTLILRSINQPDENEKQDNDLSPISINAVLKESKSIDDSIRSALDVQVALPISILNIKEAINKDESIENKPFAYANAVHEHIVKLKMVVFDLNKTMNEKNEEIKNSVILLNNLANSLREEERAKLRLTDITYKPAKVKQFKPAKVTINKIDKKTIRELCKNTGVSEITLRAVMVARNLTPQGAIDYIKNIATKLE
jgi:hypothetical protein